MAEFFYTDAEGKIRGPVPYKKLHAMAAFGSVPRDARVMEAGVDAQAGGEQPWRPIAEVLPTDTLPTESKADSKNAQRSGSIWAAWSLASGAIVFLIAGVAPMCLALPFGGVAVTCGIVAFLGGRGPALTSGAKAMAIIGLVLGSIGLVAGLGGLMALVPPASQPSPSAP